MRFGWLVAMILAGCGAGHASRPPPPPSAGEPEPSSTLGGGSGTGSASDGCDTASDGLEVWLDADRDRHGAGLSFRVCEQGAYALVGDDCDDTNPEAYPGAFDEPYDGLDADCRGDDDFDQDADGAHGGAGGDDCDDTNPSVYPGAPDPPYDGLDADCDGGPEDDLDGDGFLRTDDCDDLDPSVYPGAPDAPYDGRDSDCAADDDFDADHDGVPVDDDCDDLDPLSYPGAVETCGLDRDCDGWSTPCIAYIEDGGGHWQTEPGAVRTSVAGDVDGDGRTDLLVGGDISLVRTGDDHSATLLLPGASLRGAGRARDITVASWEELPGDDAPSDIAYDSSSGETAGDVNGDGLDDLWVNQGSGLYRLYYAPFSGRLLPEDSAGRIFQSGRVLGLGDWTGDGVPDAMALSTGDHFAILAGPVEGDVDLYDDAHLLIADAPDPGGGYTQGDSWGDWADDAGDLDGDGEPELLVMDSLSEYFDRPTPNQGDVYLFSPERLSGSILSTDADVILTTLTDRRPLGPVLAAGADDLDGDGYGDLVLNDVLCGDAYVCVAYGPIVPGNLLDNRYTRIYQLEVGVADRTVGEVVSGVGDMDGDGRGDIAWPVSIDGELELRLAFGGFPHGDHAFDQIGSWRLVNRGPGGMSSSSGEPLRPGLPQVRGADFDGDGLADVATACSKGCEFESTYGFVVWYGADLLR